MEHAAMEHAAMEHAAMEHAAINIVCIGGGRAGLYVALRMKQQGRAHHQQAQEGT